MSTRKRDDVDLLDLQDRIANARHTAALAALAVHGIFQGIWDKDALQGLEALLNDHRDALGEIGRDVAAVRATAPSLKLVTA